VRNYLVEENLAPNLPKKVLFWDETLRDGEQTPGVSYSVDEKVRVARFLDEIGVPIMDVGIPVISEQEMRAVKAITKEGLDATIIAAARTLKKDVDACVEADADETSIFVACSDLHLKYKLRMTREEVIQASVECTEHALDHGLKVSFVTEDTVRADLDYVQELYTAAIEAGATRAVLCDTVGVMTPTGMRWWIEEVKRRLPPVQLSIHCHNDFGMAVANSLAAIECGVEVPHTTVNGIGERSGNASFEELVMALEKLYGYDTGIDTVRLYELSRLVEELSGIPLAVNKPVVGYNAFSHESGIHAHGVLMHTLTYEPMKPEELGRKRRFIFGKQTGSAAVIDKLEKEGVKATDEQVAKIVKMIKETAEQRKKDEQIAFIKEFREREEKRRGVTETEFWEIVRATGVSTPK